MTTDDQPIPAGDLRSLAIRRLNRRRGFFAHLTSYLIVNGTFVVVWVVLGLTTDAWFPWPLFPIAGWGIGLAFDAWATFGPPSRPIDEAAVDREIERLQGR